MEVREEVINGLRKDAGPVDRVHRTKTMLVIELAVSEKCFNYVLGIMSMASNIL